jgi:hypothetical protein
MVIVVSVSIDAGINSELCEFVLNVYNLVYLYLMHVPSDSAPKARAKQFIVVV